MRRRPRSVVARGAVAGAVLAVAILFAPATSLAAPPSAARSSGTGPALGAASIDAAVAELRGDPRAPVTESAAEAAGPDAVPLPTAAEGTLTIVVTLPFANQSGLTQLLGRLARPDDAAGAHDVSAAEFDREFAPAYSTYERLVAYFASFGVAGLTTFSDRATISFRASPTVAGAIFGTSIGAFEQAGVRFEAPTRAPTLPGPLASAVAQVEGLGTGPATRGMPQTLGRVSLGATVPPARAVAPALARYPAPVQLGKAQLEYASDFQVAYDEGTFLGSYGPPTNETVVLLTAAGNYSGANTTTRCGSLTTGENVGAWVPGDVEQYYNTTMPRGQPKATVTGVPLLGAPAPGCLASWDDSPDRIVAGNTADLEMIGSTAPGAKIFGVYAPSPSQADLDLDFATTLDGGTLLGPSLAAKLANASVIVTPWGFADGNDSSWYESAEEAEAEGISLVAAAGNAGDDPASPAWVGTDVEFPASMGYNDFGETAVGAATTTLDPTTLTIAHQVAWWVPTADGGPYGDSGGPSQVFIKQPTWQKNSLAGELLGSEGRGVPDLVALGSNTTTTVSVDGHRDNATNVTDGGPFYNASGTGLAAALVAGELAEIDHALRSEHDAPLGYADPSVYPVASLELTPLPNGKVHGSAVAGTYTSDVGALAVFNVPTGKSDGWVAGKGYNLVTGWGSLDVYNFTMYVIEPPSLPASGPLQAVEDWVNLTGLGVGKGALGASVQQNTFLANSLGAPIIWVQSVLFLAPKPSGAWTVNFTGWVVVPFWGLYPSQSVYEFWYPATGKTESLPTSWDLTTTLDRGAPSWESTITFSFGNGVAPFTLAVPGADYMIGSPSTTYNWQGENYSNGPRGPTPSVPQFLAPQIGLYGYSGGATANFTSATAGTIQAFVERVGAKAFAPARTSPVTTADVQTGEVGDDLAYTEVAPNTYSLGYDAGAEEEGVTTTVPYPYPVTFSETGAPVSLTWTIAVADGPTITAQGSTSSLSVDLENGSYSWTAKISSTNYTEESASGRFTVSGPGASVAVVYYAKSDSVTFEAVGGMAFPFDWSIAVTAGPTLTGEGKALETNLTYAKYSYRVLWTNVSWTPKHTSGSFVIGATAAVVVVNFTLDTFRAQFRASYGINEFSHWSISIDGAVKTGSIQTTLYFELPNGTYRYSISGLAKGYSASPSSGTFTVHGDPPPKILVHIIPPPTFWSPFGLGLLGYALVAGPAGAGVAAFWLVRRRRRRQRAAAASRPPPPDRRGPNRRPPRPAPEARPRPAERRPPPPPPRRGGGYVPPDEL